MSDPACLHLLLLDEDWRPLHRLDSALDWRRTVDELLRSDSRWIAIEQRRPGPASTLPSWSDIHLTRALSKRLKPMEIAVADHIISSGGDRFSFRAAGLL